eukprot:680371-Prymnesium_polylepis.1
MRAATADPITMLRRTATSLLLLLLRAATADPTPDGVGRVAIVQYDNRFCASRLDSRSSRAAVTSGLASEASEGVRNASRVCGVVVDGGEGAAAAG